MGKFILYLSTALCFCLYSCKETKQKGQQVDNMTEQIDTIVTVKKESIEERFISDFKQIFAEECKKWPVNFSIDTTNQYQPWHDNLNLLEHDSLISSSYLLFVDGNINYRSVALESFILSDEKDAIKMIDDHCEAYYQAERKGKTPGFIYENVYAKFPYTAIRLDSIIFEITATNTVGHIMHNTIKALCDKYNISENDIIPCNRNNISQNLASKLRPKVSEWLKFHNIDIYHFINYGSSGFGTEGHNNYTMSNEELAYKPKLRDYSPNRKYYLNVLEIATFYDPETKTYEVGFDDSQTIWLFDIANKTASEIQFFGAASLCEATIWIDNNTFVLLGRHYYDTKDFFMILFDLKNKSVTSYYNRNKGYDNDNSYFYKNLEQRGIFINQNGY